MNRGAKVGIVGSGYLLAIAAATAAGYLYDVRMSRMPYDTSGGMYAAGNAMSTVAVFLVVALVPTLLGLWFLRANKTLWQVVAVTSLAFAGAGLLAVLMFMASPGSPSHPALMLFTLFGLAQLLGVPLWTVGFVLFAFLAPTGPARRLLVAAIGIELVIAVCAVFHWFGRSSPL